MAQDSDSVKAIKALEDVEKHLQDVKARIKRGCRWAWQQDGVTYIDAFGFGAVTDRAGKAIEEAAPLFEVYLHALGRVPPRFKAVFEQAAALVDWMGSLEYQYGSEYHLARALQRLQRVESGLQGLCTQPSKAAAHQETKPKSKAATRKKTKTKSKAAARLQSQELQEVKTKLIAAGIIVDGVWQGTPAEFGCLVSELYEYRGIARNGGKPWTDCKAWAGYDGSIKSARNAIDSNPTTRGPIADKIRTICRAAK